LVVANDPQTIVKDGQIVKIGRYAKLLLAMFKAGNLKKEDLPRAKEYLTYVYKYGIPLDATKVLELSDIYDLIKKYMAQSSTKISDVISHLHKEEYKLLYEDSDWVIYQPLSERAACYIGVNSQWCTTWGPYSLGDNKDRTSYYQRYSKDGPLYIIINKANQQEKYQFHFESNQYMDVADRQIKVTDFLDRHPKIKTFFFPSLIREVSRKEIETEVDRVGVLQPGEGMTIIKQSISGEDYHNPLIMAILSTDQDELNERFKDEDIVSDIAYEEGYIVFPLENIPDKANYVKDTISSYRYELNSSDSNLRNDIQEGNFTKEIETFFSEYYKENYDELKENLGILNYEMFYGDLFEEFIEYEDTREAFVSEVVDLSEPEFEERYQAEIDSIEKYIKFSQYSRTEEVSLSAIYLIRLLAKKNIREISDNYSILDVITTYIIEYKIQQEFEPIYDYQWKYPVYSDGGTFHDFINDYFENLMTNNEVTRDCIETRKLFNTVYHRLFKDKNTFENDHVIVTINNMNINCDKGTVNIYYKNKDNNQEYTGDVKVENLHTYVTNYDLFEHFKKRFNRIIL
jgi:hypothetical protein